MEPKRILKEFNDLAAATPSARDQRDPVDAIIPYFQNVIKFSQNRELRAKVKKTMLQVCEEQIKALGSVSNAESFKTQLSKVEKLVDSYMLSRPPLQDRKKVLPLLQEQIKTIREWKVVAWKYPLFGLDESLMDSGISKLNTLIRENHLLCDFGKKKGDRKKQM
ncbi:MAG: hypothetical protein GC185_06725 [Alphaproteobacteria bacterium]|nr:hypothetical protein [Alphaproteobacteria bacterium]